MFLALQKGFLTPKVYFITERNTDTKENVCQMFKEKLYYLKKLSYLCRKQKIWKISMTLRHWKRCS